MARIEIFTDPAGIRKFTTHKLEKGTNLMDFLIKQFGANGFSVPYRLYEGCVHSENEILLEKFTDQGIIIKESDVFILILNPLGIETIVTTFVISAIVGFGASYLASQLLPTPKMPNSERVQANESPNNSLTGQTNVARPLERIPSIYGKNRVYPDLISQSLYGYENNLKKVTEWYCVGVGEYLVEDVRNDTTALNDVIGQSYEVYQPNTTISEQWLPKLYDQVDGIDIVYGTDWEFITDTNTIHFVNPNKIDVVSPFGELPNGTAISITGTGGKFDPHPHGNDGTFTKLTSASGFTTFDLGGVSWYPFYYNPSYPLTITFENKFKGYAKLKFRKDGIINKIEWYNNRVGVSVWRIKDKLIINSGIGEIPLAFDIAGIDGNYLIVSQDVSKWSDPYWVAECDVTQVKHGSGNNIFKIDEDYSDVIRCNFVAQQGESATTYFNIDVLDDDNLLLKRVTGVISCNQTDMQYLTVDVDMNGISRSNGVKVKVKQTNSSTIKWKWEALIGINKVQNVNYGDVTIIKQTKQATLNPLRGQSQKFNCLVTRKLKKLLDGNIMKALQSTSRMCDAVIEVLTNPKSGNKSLSEIDLTTLEEIQNSLDLNIGWGSKLGEFNYSFSNKNTSVAEELNTILNACRCYCYREGNYFKFGRDEKRLYPRTLFNSRNKKPNSETKTIVMHKPSDFGGIEFQWIEQVENEPQVILIPETATNYKRIESAGIKSYEQAYNRALFEYQKLKLKRVQVKTTVTKEGLLVSVGDRVSNADGTSLKSIDGEILAVSGLEIKTNRKIAWGTETSGIIIIRGENGEVETIICEPSEDEFSVILQYLPTFDIIIGGGNYQIGSLFCLKIADNIYNDFTVDKITPQEDNYVELELSNYTDELYLNDEEIPN